MATWLTQAADVVSLWHTECMSRFIVRGLSQRKSRKYGFSRGIPGASDAIFFGNHGRKCGGHVVSRSFSGAKHFCQLYYHGTQSRVADLRKRPRNIA